jgi:hypothetical protein
LWCYKKGIAGKTLLVDPTNLMAQFANKFRLHLDLLVYEKDLPRLKENQVIHFTLTNNPGKEYDTKTIPIHAVVMEIKQA